MARPDSIGLFWQDVEEIKIPKPPPVKCTPPPRTWDAPDYLPGLEEALRFSVPLFDRESLLAAKQAREPMVMDIEVYPNYFLVCFSSTVSNRVIYFEFGECSQNNWNADYVRWILQNFLIVGFSSNTFDMPILALALSGGFDTAKLKMASDRLIMLGERHYNLLRTYRVKIPDGIDHIDLIEVCPLQASLKIYGGRLHAKRMQDLPFSPHSELTQNHAAIVRYYCVNDLSNTALVFENLKDQLGLRTSLSQKYGADLRSKSDAQIAEVVIGAEVERMNYVKPRRPEIPPGTKYKYQVPNFIAYMTPVMQAALAVVRNADFVVEESGAIGLPEEIKNLDIKIGSGVYTMGVGGLHSNEKRVSYKSNENHILLDRDVTSYYPSIILNLGLYPKHLGQNFLTVYRSLVERRVAAKKAGNKIEADCLKIVANGSFGKLGSKWSILYAPDLLIQVTLTGQLALLMLIEWLESAGIKVCSANTDGIVVLCPKHLHAHAVMIFEYWERVTGFKTEETRYAAIYSKDVNNYIAVKEDGKTKTKGLYNNPWNTKGEEIFRFHKNPTNSICVEAVVAYLTKQTPLNVTVQACRDITRFVTVRTVKGGAVKGGGAYLGKSLRWYYAVGEEGEMIYAENGHKVPRSEGAKPCLQLPEEFPSDVDYEYYIREAEDILKDIAAD